MPEVLDTAGTGTQSSTAASSEGDESGRKTEKSTSEEPFVGTYRTREDTEKGIKEKDTTINRYKDDRNRLIQENKKLQEQVLSKLTDAVAAKTSPAAPAKSEADVMAEVKVIAEKIDEGGGEVIVDVLNSYLRDTEVNLTKSRRAELESLKSEVEGKITKLEGLMADRDPEYLAVGPQRVTELMEELGCDRTTAVKVAKRYEAKPAQPERPAVPGNTSADRVTTQGDEGTLKQESVDFLESMPQIGKLTDAEKKALAKGART